MKRGQLELSFGMIFTIILIAVFIAFAIYIVLTFLNFSDKVKIEQFQGAIQEDINDIWKSPQGNKQVSYGLPKQIEKVCFFDKSSPAKGKDKDLHNLFIGLSLKENLMFYPESSGEGEDGLVLENIDISKITAKDNPYCVENSGKLELTISMNYGEGLVTIQ